MVASDAAVETSKTADVGDLLSQLSASLSSNPNSALTKVLNDTK